MDLKKVRIERVLPSIVPFSVCLWIFGIVCFDLCHPVGSSPSISSRVLEISGTISFIPEGWQYNTQLLLSNHLLVTLYFQEQTWMVGDQLRLRGWLRPLQGKPYWRRQGITQELVVWERDGVLFHQQTTNLWRYEAFCCQKALQVFYNSHLPKEEAALLSAMTIGTQQGLSKTTKENFRAAGIYHLLVVSGQQVSAILILMFLILQGFRLRRSWAWITLIPLIWFYAAIVGNDPPVLRSATTGTLGLFLWNLQRDPPSLYVFLWTAFLLLIGNPALLRSPSFQLSFGAVACLLMTSWIVDPWKRRCPRWIRIPIEPLLHTLTISIGLGPLLVYYFHRCSWVSPLANLIVAPCADTLLFVGLFLGILGILHCPIPLIAWNAVRWGIHWLLILINQMAHWPGVQQELTNLPIFTYVLYYLVLFGILFWIFPYVQTQRSRQNHRPRL